MSYSINFSDVDDELTLIPEGPHTVVIAEVSMKPSAAGDSYNLVWELVLTESGPSEGRKLRMWTSLKPTALWRLKSILKGLGKYNDILEIEVDEDTDLVTQPSFVGTPAIAVVAHSKYQDRMTAGVAELLPIDSADGSPKTAKKAGRKLV